jgi:hypothetical protein
MDSTFEPRRMRVAQEDLNGLQDKMLSDMGGEIIEAEIEEQEPEEELEIDPDTGEVVPSKEELEQGVKS